MLFEFIAVNRGEIIRRCRAKVASRSTPPPTSAEVNHGVPMFLDQLADALRLRLTSHAEIGETALQHGHDMLLQGFTVSQVVHDYGDVCQAITELAVETNAPISTEDFRTLNRCLDDAIAGAVTEYGRARNQSTLEGEVARGSERLWSLAHELRNLVNTAIIAFEVLKTGNVGVAGSTGALLHHRLLGIRALLAKVPLTPGVHHREQFLVSEFIQELEPAAKLQAEIRGIRLIVAPLEDGVVIEADRHVLAAVVEHLLENAFKFTRPDSAVTLRVSATAERVLIEIEDACGGLPGDTVDDLFRPFEQRRVDQIGLGLGLAFSRWSIEANGGRFYARNLPGEGCIFTADLPRLAVYVLSGAEGAV